MLAQALFERIEVRGFREVTLRLTENARAWLRRAATGAVRNIRKWSGERSGADTIRVNVRIASDPARLAAVS